MVNGWFLGWFLGWFMVGHRWVNGLGSACLVVNPKDLPVTASDAPCCRCAVAFC